MPEKGLLDDGRYYASLVRSREFTMAETLATRTTFAVSKVSPATEPLRELPYHHAVANFVRRPVESCSRYHGRLVAHVVSHPLIAALHEAFASHRPLCLSPDIIWLTITQGLAVHVNQNAERLRHHFVANEGKVKIEVRRDDFIKGSPENAWPEVFSEFSGKIQAHIGQAHALIVADFSTTGPVERAASEVALLDSMQSYFDYALHTACGIPSITLEGTAEDWGTISDRVQQFAQFDLDWWIRPLRRILEKFIDAASGKVDQKFWDSIYKYRGPKGSGSPRITGWVSAFFPYVKTLNGTFHRNRSLGAGFSKGRDTIPALPCKAPFKWKYLQTTYDMEFIGGLIGVSQDPRSLSLRPEIGWAVRETRSSGKFMPQSSDSWKCDPFAAL